MSNAAKLLDVPRVKEILSRWHAIVDRVIGEPATLDAYDRGEDGNHGIRLRCHGQGGE